MLGAPSTTRSSSWTRREHTPEQCIFPHAHWFRLERSSRGRTDDLAQGQPRLVAARNGPVACAASRSPIPERVRVAHPLGRRASTPTIAARRRARCEPGVIRSSASRGAIPFRPACFAPVPGRHRTAAGSYAAVRAEAEVMRLNAVRGRDYATNVPPSSRRAPSSRAHRAVRACGGA